MTNIKIDYSNTIFYKIYCKDPNIKELYIGHTTNFVQRKHGHKQSCINVKSANHNCKVYKVIRDNNGWDNWIMEIIAFHNCDDLFSAKKQEQYYYEEYKATLNSIEPLSKPNPNPTPSTVVKKKREIIYCNTCNIYLNTHKLQDKHNKTNKHLKLLSEPEKSEAQQKISENASNFNCIDCNFKCRKEGDWKRHLMTRKHSNEYKRVTKDTILTHENAKTYDCDCGKKYNHRQGLSRHKKRCSIVQGEENKSNNIDTGVMAPYASQYLTEKMVELVMSKNHEFMTEFMTKMTDFMPNIQQHN